MKRVGLIAPFMLPQIGGAAIYCFQIARGLAELGYEVHLFSYPGALADPSYTLHEILTRDLAEDLRRLDAFDMDVWHSLYFYYAPLALSKPRVFVTGHGDDFFSLRLRFTWPLGRWLRHKLFWRLPDSVRAHCDAWIEPWERRYNQRRFAQAIEQAKQLIAVSTFSRERFFGLYPDARGKTSVVPPGVNEAFFAERARPLGHRRLLTVTRLDQDDRIKNVHGVVQALGALKDEADFEYDIVAGTQSGSYRAEIESLIEQFGLQKRVRIHNRLPLEELIQHYREADLFVLVSYAEPDNFEGFGIVFLEANAAGTPVLTSRQGGMADYVEEGVNGFYVRDPSAAGVAEALRRFFRNEVRFDSEKVRSKPQPYRWSCIVRQVADLYERQWDRAASSSNG